MDIFRTFSDDLVDAIINHPSIRGTMQEGEYRLRSAHVVHNPLNVILCNGAGCALFVKTGPRAYMGHVAVLAGHRGAQAVTFGRAALAQLFTNYDALTCLADVPLQLRAARYFVRKLGFRSLGPVSIYERFVMETE